MRKALAALALLLAVAAGVFFSRPAPEAPRETPVPITQPTPAPAYVPPESAAPAPPLPASPHWGLCSGFSGLQRNEDAALVLVLASTVEDDELFGLREITLEMANCAAYRERCGWMGCR